MKKSIGWKIFFLSFAFVIFCFSYISTKIEYIDLYSQYTDPILFISLSLLIVSPFLFLLRETAFFSWVRFAVFWFAGTVIGIVLAPEYWGGWMSFGPTKELVSIWSGIFFIFTSLLFIVWKRRA